MKVKKHNLLLLASIVWLIAGFNVLNIGIKSYKGYVNIINIPLSILVFFMFWLMIFKKLVVKHTFRITNLDDIPHFFLNFFDKKSFLIMFFMIFLGICLRLFHLAPMVFIAIFYTGLGFSLFLAGILFLFNYLNYKSKRSILK